jgi:hypothetical protein
MTENLDTLTSTDAILRGERRLVEYRDPRYTPHRSQSRANGLFIEFECETTLSTIFELAMCRSHSGPDLSDGVDEESQAAGTDNWTKLRVG